MFSLGNLFHMFPFDHKAYLLEFSVMAFNFQSFPGLDNIFLSEGTFSFHFNRFFQICKLYFSWVMHTQHPPKAQHGWEGQHQSLFV